MSFNADPRKQAEEVAFRCKIKVTDHSQLVFNNNPVHQTSIHKHLRIFLDFELTFQENFENVPNKVIKTMGLLRILQNTLPRPSSLTILSYFLDHTFFMVILSTIKRIMHLFN